MLLSLLTTTLILTLLGAGDSALIEAEELYFEARYEETLERLGTNCQGFADVVTCERLRAFAQAGLGDSEAAKLAFGRMLAADPEAELDDDISPKLQTLFDAAKSARRDIKLALEPIILPSEDAAWDVVLPVPPGMEVVAVSASISPDGTDAYYDLQLRKREHHWAGIFTPKSGGLGVAQYTLNVVLADGETLTLGSRAVPKTLVVSLDGDVSPRKGTGGDRDDKIAGLPPWAFWGAIGGAAAIVIAGVTTAIVLSRRTSEGAVLVNVELGALR